MTCNASHVARDFLICSSLQSVPFKNEPVSLDLSGHKSKASSSTLSIQEQQACCEAQFVDIPIPLMAQPLGVACNEQGGVLLSYDCLLTIQVLTTFYIQEMERLGWQQTIRFESNEFLFS